MQPYCDAREPARMTQMQAERTRKVTGHGQYTADEWRAGGRFAAPAFGVYVRSPHAAARIRALDTSAAAAMPGVLRIVTADDCAQAGFSTFPVMSAWGSVPAPIRPSLAAGAVRHAGEAVALVVAESQAQAMDAAEAVAVDYEVVPAVIGIAAALAPDAPAVHDALPGNVVFVHRNGDAEAVAAAMAEAALVIETEIELPRLAPMIMEPRASVARFDQASGEYIVRVPHQGVNEIRRDLSVVMGLPAERFLVLPGDVGGGFGPRNSVYPDLPALLLAARLTERTVVWAGSRGESFLTDLQGRGVRVSGRLALDREGRFTALSVTYDADLGAYVSPVSVVANIRNPLASLTGCYVIPAAHASFRLVFTNAAATGPYRGAGRPEISLLVERLVDLAARRLGEDRFRLRGRNAIPKDAFPYALPSGAQYDSGDFARLLEGAREAAGWDRFADRQARSRGRGLLRGRGVALFIEVSGGGQTPDEAALTLLADHGAPRLRIETVSGATGQSHPTTFATIARTRLGLDEADVTLVASDAATRLGGAGSYASRSTITTGSAVALAADEIAAKLRGLAASRTNHGVDELHLAEGEVRLADGTAVCSIVSLLSEPIAALGSYQPSNAFASGCHVAEVEIDPDTGTARLARYVAVDDAGVTIDHAAAAAQIHGGIAQGVGEALSEEAVLDAAGQPVAASLMDYAVPRADDLPDYTVLECDTPSPFNPIGVKGIGEAGTTGALCAVTSAVADALGERALPGLPYTAHRLWRALRV
jgi:aerobic carbon-monoxide dehydrogenase large subunit